MVECCVERREYRERINCMTTLINFSWNLTFSRNSNINMYKLQSAQAWRFNSKNCNKLIRKSRDSFKWSDDNSIWTKNFIIWGCHRIKCSLIDGKHSPACNWINFWYIESTNFASLKLINVVKRGSISQFIISKYFVIIAKKRNWHLKKLFWKWIV